MRVPLSWLGEYVPVDVPTGELAERLSVSTAEVKAIERLASIHEAQLLTYLRLAEKKLGLLINFNATTLKNSIRRVVNNL